MEYQNVTSGPRKGGRYEREVCKKLSKWLTDGKSNNELIRSVNSGGWKNKNIQQIGDIAPNGKYGEEFRKVFALELKARQEFDWHHLWSSDSPKLLEWWDKLSEECRDPGTRRYFLVPLLIFKRNYVPDVICAPARMIISSAGVRVNVNNRIKILKLGDLLTTPASDFITEGLDFLNEQ